MTMPTNPLLLKAKLDILLRVGESLMIEHAKQAVKEMERLNLDPSGRFSATDTMTTFMNNNATMCANILVMVVELAAAVHLNWDLTKPLPEGMTP